jgi:Butirosin biosynthesis protein H, N-terminal/Domain of unknown function (DUF4872)
MMGARLESPIRNSLGMAIHVQSFQAQPGVHCETTMLGNMLHHAGVDLSEPMLFGLGEGIDFQYHESPDPATQPPMLTGRVDAGLLARKTCAALGIELVETQSADEDAAHAVARSVLASDRVVGVTVDIYHLDYFGSHSHFSAHCIALYGLDDAVANVVDTTQQGGALELPVASLRRARSSNEGYMPSPHRQFHIGELSPEVNDDLDSLVVEQAWVAIHATAERMITPRGDKLGPAAIRLASSDLPAWADKMEDPGLRLADLGRFWRFAGTGGTNFRGLFRDFLAELELRSADPDLPMFVEDFEWIHSQWTETIDLLISCAEGGAYRPRLEAAQKNLRTIADAEERFFRRLLALAGERVRGRR